MNETVPASYRAFTEEYPTVWEADDRLGTATHRACPLDVRARALVQLALSIGLGAEGAVHPPV